MEGVALHTIQGAKVTKHYTIQGAKVNKHYAYAIQGGKVVTWHCTVLCSACNTCRRQLKVTICITKGHQYCTNTAKSSP